MQKISIKNLAGALLLFAYQTVYAIDPTLLTLESAINRVIQDNPNLAQMQARAEAMAAIPSQEGSLPDPQLGFNVMNLPTNSFSLRQENMTQLGFSLSQGIPFPGKLALREQTANYKAQAATFDVDTLRLRLLGDIKTLWWQLFYLNRTEEILKENHQLLKQFVDIANSKYAVGQGLQQDVLLAQLELSKLLERQINLTAMQQSTSARLNALLNQPANTTLHLPNKLAIHLPKLKSETKLYQQAELSSPLLASQQQNIQAAQSKLELAKKDILPDFMVKAAYGGRADMPDGSPRADMFSVGVSMNVPIFAATKQNKAIDQRSSELMQQRYNWQDQKNSLQAQISQSYSDYQRGQQQFVLFDTGIIPQARQTVASMLAGYQVNKVDFLNLVRSQITLFEYQIQYWRVFTEAQQALAQLTANVGEEAIYE